VKIGKQNTDQSRYDIQSLISRAEQFRYRILFGALALVSICHPFFDQADTGQRLLDLMLFLLFVTAIFAVSRTRKQLIIALVLGIPALSALTATLLTRSGGFRTTSSLSTALFLGYVMAIILNDVLRSRSISTDQVFGGICAYLLMGISWGFIYVALERLDPGAFQMSQALVEEHPETFQYYSFVTLTTLGYGDITPVTPPARTFSWLVAVCGQLYIAVLIARLVGQHLMTRRDDVPPN